MFWSLASLWRIPAIRTNAPHTALPLEPDDAEPDTQPASLAEVIALPGARRAEGGRRGWRQLTRSEAGMATAEYAIATLAAVAFAGLLVLILRSGEVRGMLMSLVELALAAV